MLLLDVCHVVRAKEADDGFEDVARIVALVFTEIVEIVHVETLWNGDAELESVHVWHLVVIPVDVDAENFGEWLLNKMDLLGLLYRTLAVEVTDWDSLLV